MTKRGRFLSNGHGRYLPPWILQILGCLIIIGGAVFWAVTGHQSALIIGTGVALVGLGAYSGLHISIRQEIDAAKRDREDDIEDDDGAPWDPE